MAKLSRDDVLKLAQLANLELTDEEVLKFQSEIGAILGYVEQLQTAKLGKLEPTNQVTGLSNVMRPDVVKNYGISQDDLLKNAPQRQDSYIKVRRVL